MDIFNVVPLIEYSHNKIISSILPQPLMLDVLQALQSSEYSYILNAAHSDTLAVILQNLFSFNTVFPHLVSSWCPKQKVLNYFYYVYLLSFSRIATVASLPNQRSHYFLLRCSWQLLDFITIQRIWLLRISGRAINGTPQGKTVWKKVKYAMIVSIFSPLNWHLSG